MKTKDEARTLAIVDPDAGRDRIYFYEDGRVRIGKKEFQLASVNYADLTLTVGAKPMEVWSKEVLDLLVTQLAAIQQAEAETKRAVKEQYELKLSNLREWLYRQMSNLDVTKDTLAAVGSVNMELERLREQMSGVVHMFDKIFPVEKTDAAFNIADGEVEE